MRIAEYKQVSTKTITKTIHHEEEPIETTDGETVGVKPAWDETITEEIPVMGMVYRDATPEEEAEAAAEAERMAEIERNREPTAEERLAMVEDAFAELCEVIFNG